MPTEPQFSWSRGYLSGPDAERLLKNAAFHFHPRSGALWSASGFFVSADGVALTADHNVRPEPAGSLLVAHYQGQALNLEWIDTWSSAEADIAVLRLCKGQRTPEIHSLKVAYLDPRLPFDKRRVYWAGRQTCIYGFPVRGKVVAGHCLEAAVDASRPITPLNEASPVGEEVAAERLTLVGNPRVSSLEGMSGAPVLDLQLGCIVAVQGSYDLHTVVGEDGSHYIEGSGYLFASEIAQLVDRIPDLADTLGFRRLRNSPPGRRPPYLY